MGIEGELFVVTSDGRQIPVEVSGKISEVNGKSLILAIYRDISERKKTEEKLGGQARLLDLAQDAIVVRDLDDRVEYCNKAAIDLFGWAEADPLGRAIGDILRFDEKPIQKAKESLMVDGEWIGELLLTTYEGEEIIIMSRWTLVKDEMGKARSILTMSTDMTEKKSLEARFLRAQRLEGIGTLAGGIAHDLNNILAPIMMAVGLLSRKELDASSRKFLSIIDKSSQRATSIVKQVLTFARGIEGERILVQPKHLVNEMVKITRETFPKNIELNSSIAADLWVLLGDPSQLHQVLLNLCVNSRDAMPDGGQMTVKAYNFTVDDNFSSMHPDARPGPYVTLEVHDSGIGIPSGAMQKIFDPFFYHQGPGKGHRTGTLDLAGYRPEPRRVRYR
jgi:PAS domain S-box-containing protein